MLYAMNGNHLISFSPSSNHGASASLRRASKYFLMRVSRKRVFFDGA
jgi:hypothetical protein